MTFTSVLSSSYSGSPIIYARAVCIFSIIILSFIFLLLEIRGAVYMQETIGGIIESNVKTMEKVKAILSLFFDNLGYMHYSFLVVLAVLSIFNPIFDSIILILELFRRS